MRPIYTKEVHGFFESARLGVTRGVATMPERRVGKEKSLFKIQFICFDLVGSVSTLNTMRRERQHTQGAFTGTALDYDPFSLKNSTKEFRTRCDKVSVFS